jgi:hypothetical protein
MESLKSIEQTSELSVEDVLGEQGNVLPERALMRHRRRHLIQGNSLAFANNGSAANSSSVTQIGFGNTNTTTQTSTVINIF